LNTYTVQEVQGFKGSRLNTYTVQEIQGLKGSRLIQASFRNGRCFFCYYPIHKLETRIASLRSQRWAFCILY